MAQLFRLFSVAILLFSLANAVTAVPLHEVESMINALRATGYNLFGNAIITSDINYEVLSGTSFTIFAPTDSSLFALDMTATAADYITALHYHVVPRRFSLSELRTFPSGASLSSLDRSHDIVLERRRSVANEIVTVDGVAIVVPDLFYGRDIVVHGLGGIISLRSQIGSGEEPPLNMTGNKSNDTSGFAPQVNLHAAPSPEDMFDFGGFEPSSNDEIDNYRPVASPIPEPASVYGFSPTNSPGSVTAAFHNSPESANSAFDISPAYAAAPDIPASRNLAEGTEAPPSSVSKGNHRRRHQANQPGDSKMRKSDLNSPGKYRISLFGLDEQGPADSIGISGNIHATVREDELYGTSVPAPEYYWPFVEKNVDCPLTENQVADTMTCAQT